MSQHWLNANAPRFMAEILRDFCVVSIALEEQFGRYDNAGNISYTVLREIMGDQMNRGILWRLKDTAHHLLRDVHASPVAARLLDWAIGYLFHETFKLMEDTHQHQYYAPSIFALAGDKPSPDLDAVARDFTLMAVETQTDMGRTVGRIRRLLAHARLFFHRCYADQKDNIELARLLYDQEAFITAAFAGEFGNLRRAIYGDALQTLYINASLSFLRVGKKAQAEEAWAKAMAIAPEDPRLQSVTWSFA